MIWLNNLRKYAQKSLQFSSVQFSSVAQSCPTLCSPMNRSTPGLLVYHQLLELTQTHAHRVGDAIQPSHPLLPLSPPAPNPSRIRVFSIESTLRMRWPKYWSFSFSISPSNEHPGLISFRMDWLDLLAVQRTLKSLLPTPSSKASLLWRSAFFIAQLSHPYIITGKTIALTIRTFVGKVMSLLFNMLSRLVITFLPRRKCLLISWLQSLSAVILEPINKVSHCFHCFPIYLPWSDGTGCHDLSFLNVELYASSLVFLHSLQWVVSSAYLRLLIFLLAVLIPACASSSSAFLMMYSAYKLNKQGDNIQPCCTHFPIWNQCVVPCPVLTVASWPAYRFLKRQVRWSGMPNLFQNFLQFIVIHTVKAWHSQ